MANKYFIHSNKTVKDRVYWPAIDSIGYEDGHTWFTVNFAGKPSVQYECSNKIVGIGIRDNTLIVLCENANDCLVRVYEIAKDEILFCSEKDYDKNISCSLFNGNKILRLYFYKNGVVNKDYWLDDFATSYSYIDLIV